MSSSASAAQPSGWVGAFVTRLSSFVRAPRPAPGSTPREESDRAADDGMLFEGLQDILRVAVDCPPGESGDDIRRTACELVEAHSVRDRASKRKRLLSAIARVEARRSRGRSLSDDPSAALLRRLSDALRRR